MYSQLCLDTGLFVALNDITLKEGSIQLPVVVKEADNVASIKSYDKDGESKVPRNIVSVLAPPCASKHTLHKTPLFAHIESFSFACNVCLLLPQMARSKGVAGW